MQLDEDGVRTRYLIRDRDSKFSRDFDEVFRRRASVSSRRRCAAPKARAHAERWVSTVRRECLDRTLILGGHHLHHVLVASPGTTTSIARTGHSGSSRRSVAIKQSPT